MSTFDPPEPGASVPSPPNAWSDSGSQWDDESFDGLFDGADDESFDGPSQRWDSWDDEPSDRDFYDEGDDEDGPSGRRRFRRIAVGVLVVAAVVGLGIVVLRSRDDAASTATTASPASPASTTTMTATATTATATTATATTATTPTTATTATATTATTATAGSGGLVPATTVAGSTTVVASTGAPTETTVGASTTAPLIVAPAATAGTTSSATTLPAGPNVLGLENGTAANPLSPLPQERFAAQIGRQSTEVSAGSPASVYADWWVLFLVRTSDVVASPNGFSFTDRSGQRIELSQMLLGPDGKVADLTECVSTASSAPACNVISEAITVDPTVTVVGRTPRVTFTRLAEVRLLKRFVVRFVEHEATQPITAATSTVGVVRFNSRVLAFEVPAGNVPATVDVALTYTDGTTETVTITV